MARFLKITTMVVSLLMLGFMFMPTGTSASDVVAGYQSTLSYANDGTMLYRYADIIAAGDPYLKQVEAAAGNGVAYLWVREDGTHVECIKTSAFPRRAGTAEVTAAVEDNLKGTKEIHQGTDYVPTNVRVDQEKLYQVALWSGTVIQVLENTDAYGYCVTIDHGDGFYTRYAHMGYGNASSLGGQAPAWQRGTSGSSLLVEEGDYVMAGERLGCLGSTGASTAPHAHIELILAPLGFDWSLRKTDFYYAGADNILHGGKTLSECTWYHITIPDGGKVISDEATWSEILELGGR